MSTLRLGLHEDPRPKKLLDRAILLVESKFWDPRTCVKMKWHYILWHHFSPHVSSVWTPKHTFLVYDPIFTFGFHLESRNKVHHERVFWTQTLMLTCLSVNPKGGFLLGYKIKETPKSSRFIAWHIFFEPREFSLGSGSNIWWREVAQNVTFIFYQISLVPTQGNASTNLRVSLH